MLVHTDLDSTYMLIPFLSGMVLTKVTKVNTLLMPWTFGTGGGGFGSKADANGSGNGARQVKENGKAEGEVIAVKQMQGSVHRYQMLQESA